MSGLLHHGRRLLAAALVPTLLLSAPDPGAASDSVEFNVRQWHEDDGLPSECVTQIHQDARGHLWVATATGLMRFDGSVFTPVPPFAGVKPVTPPIQFMAQAGEDEVYLVPRAGDPWLVRNGARKLAPLPAPWNGKTIVAFLQEADGTRWFALRGGVVLRVGSRGGEPRIFQAQDGISPRDISRFAADARGRVWVASDTFLGRYDPATGQLVPVPLETSGSELRIVARGGHAPWVITSDRVLSLDDEDRATEYARLPALVGAHYLAAACTDRHGVLWLGTRSLGVHRVTRGGVEHVATSSDDIRSMLEDNEGNLWVGTNTAGLNAIGPRFHRLRDKTNGLKSNACFALTVDPEGAVWVANGDGGIARERDGELLLRETRFNGATFGAVSLAPARAGAMWLTGAPGLFRVPADPRAPLEHITQVPATGVRRLTYSARNGDLWLAVDPNQVGRWREPALATFGAAEGFDAREARVMTEDATGTVWIGAAEGALFRQSGDRFVRVPLGTTRPVGDIYAIHFAADGRMWLGTGDAGILVLGGAATLALDTTRGLPDDAITHLVADNEGNLWCGSERGIFRLDRSELERFVRGELPWVNPLRLGRDEGLARVSCSGLYGPAAAKTPDGHLWFATRQGVVTIDPARVPHRLRPPVIAIEEIRIDEHALPAIADFAPSPHLRKLEFRFSVLCLSTPTRVQARFRLDGFDDAWTLAGSNRVATYPRLPPGSYTFRVSTGLGEAGEPGQAATLAFTVPPLWWQRWWVAAAGALLAMAAIALAARAWTNRRLRRAMEELERRSALERERTRIAQNIHDDVGASLTRISLLTQAITPGQPPKPETLDQIFDTTREIARSLDETVWAVNPRYDTLEGFAGYIVDYAQRYLAVANIRCRLDLPARLSDAAFGGHVRHQLFLCCREALNNVVKHAGADEVTLRIAANRGCIELAIADNGRGLAAAKRAPDVARVGGGHGLENLRRRMESLGGTCAISTGSGGGTTVTFRVDVRAAPSPPPRS